MELIKPIEILYNLCFMVRAVEDVVRVRNCFIGLLCKTVLANSFTALITSLKENCWVRAQGQDPSPQLPRRACSWELQHSIPPGATAGAAAALGAPAGLWLCRAQPGPGGESCLLSAGGSTQWLCCSAGGEGGEAAGLLCP